MDNCVMTVDPMLKLLIIFGGLLANLPNILQYYHIDYYVQTVHWFLMSILKEISAEYLLEGLTLKLKF